MTDTAGMDEKHHRFFAELLEQTAGDPQKQVSMYQIGTAIGLSKPEASHVVEDLMADGMVEIRTLSGAIGITTAAAAEYVPSRPAPHGIVLGTAVLLPAEARPVLEKLLHDIKAAVGALPLDFDAMTELTADIRTIEAQMASSRPKTNILRATLHSLLDILQNRNAANPLIFRLQEFLQ